MLEHSYKDKLVKKLSKIKKMNLKEFENIKKPINKFKRVHINSSFVLIFKIDKNKNPIVFEDYEHHNKIYKKC